MDSFTSVYALYGKSFFFLKLNSMCSMLIRTGLNHKDFLWV